MTKNTRSRAATEWDDTPPAFSQNPEPNKPIEPKPTGEQPTGEQPTEPTDKVEPEAVKETLTSAAANLPVDPERAIPLSRWKLTRTSLASNPPQRLTGPRHDQP